MTWEDVLWLFAVETASNDAGETGEWDAQDFFLEWFADYRQCLEIRSSTEGR